MLGTSNETFISHLFFSELTLGVAVHVLLYEDMWTSVNKVLLLLWFAFCILFPFWLVIPLFLLGLYGNKLLQKANLYASYAESVGQFY